MVGRALHGEVERDFHVVLLAGSDEGAEIFQRAQFRMDGVVAAFGRADRIGAAGIAFLGRHRIVAALAIGLADRVDRREIDHVEPHRRDVRQAGDAIPERAVPARNLALAAGHHFVPGAVPRPRPVGHQRKQLRARQVGARLAFGHRVLQFRDQQRRGFAGLQIVFALPDDDRLRPRRPPACALVSRPAPSRASRVKSAAGLLLQLEAVPPGREFVGPGLDGIDIAARRVRHERSAPAVVAVHGSSARGAIRGPARGARPAPTPTTSCPSR